MVFALSMGWRKQPLLASLFEEARGMCVLQELNQEGRKEAGGSEQEQVGKEEASGGHSRAD